MSESVRQRVYDVGAGLALAGIVAGSGAAIRTMIDTSIMRRDIAAIVTQTHDHEQRIRDLERGRP